SSTTSIFISFLHTDVVDKTRKELQVYARHGYELVLALKSPVFLAVVNYCPCLHGADSGQKFQILCRGAVQVHAPVCALPGERRGGAAVLGIYASGCFLRPEHGRRQQHCYKRQSELQKAALSCQEPHLRRELLGYCFSSSKNV